MIKVIVETCSREYVKEFDLYFSSLTIYNDGDILIRRHEKKSDHKIVYDFEKIKDECGEDEWDEAWAAVEAHK